MAARRSTLTLLALAGALVLALAPELGSAASAATPSNFKVSINGKTLTNAQLKVGADTYMKTSIGPTKVGVRWSGDLKGSGYYVLITDAGLHTRKRCVSGTSCLAVWSRSLRKADEMGWTVQIIRTSGNKVVSEKYVCVIGA